MIEIRNKLPIKINEFELSLLRAEQIEEYYKNATSDYYNKYLEFKCNNTEEQKEVIKNKLIENINNVNGTIRTVLLDNDKIIGTVSLFINKDGMLEIGYYVAEQYSNRGIASSMIKGVISIIKDSQYRKIYLSIDKNNIASINVALVNEFRLINENNNKLIYMREL